MAIEDEDEYKNNVPPENKQQLESSRQNADQISSTAQKQVNDVFNVADIAANLSRLTNISGIAQATIDKGGYDSPQKDTGDVIAAYNEWQKVKDRCAKCPQSISTNAISYLNSGKDQRMPAYQRFANTKGECKDCNKDVKEAANKYIETLRRVEHNNSSRANTAIAPAQAQKGPEGFSLREGANNIQSLFTVREGVEECLPPADSTLAQRESYMTACQTAVAEKTAELETINTVYTETNNAIKLLNRLTPFGKSNDAFNSEINNRAKTLNTVLEEQNKDVNTAKRLAFYENQQYETLLQAEGAVRFVFNALLVIWALIIVKNWFNTHQLDKRSVLLLIVFAIYPIIIMPILKLFIQMYNKIVTMLPVHNAYVNMLQ